MQAYSAGLHSLGSITKDTYTAMSEKGISLEGQWSKGLPDVPVAEMDVVVHMGWEIDCLLPDGFKGRLLEWVIPDPYGRGIESFRNVRDMVERRVLELLAELVPADASSH